MAYGILADGALVLGQHFLIGVDAQVLVWLVVFPCVGPRG